MVAYDVTELIVLSKSDFLNAARSLDSVAYHPHTTARGLNNIMWAHQRLLATCSEIEEQFLRREIQVAVADNAMGVAGALAWAQSLKHMARVHNLGAICSLRSLRLHWASLVPLMRRSAVRNMEAEEEARAKAESQQRITAVTSFRVAAAGVRLKKQSGSTGDSAGQRAVNKLRTEHVDNLMRRQRRMLLQAVACVSDFDAIPDGARDMLAEELQLMWCVHTCIAS